MELKQTRTMSNKVLGSTLKQLGVGRAAVVPWTRNPAAVKKLCEIPARQEDAQGSEIHTAWQKVAGGRGTRSAYLPQLPTFANEVSTNWLALFFHGGKLRL